MKFKNLFNPIAFWLLIFLLSLSLRFWYSSTELCFYTDQSRDAIVANQIIQGDWKLFGPVVNGRGAIFHGVLYYYVIAPLYALGGGSPFFVSIVLSLLSTIGLIPTYFLAKVILRTRLLPFLVVGMMSVSLSTIETSASFWNLQLSIILLPAYCLYLLKTYEHFTVLNGLITGFFLGLLVQSGFSNIQWLLPYVVVFGLALLKQPKKSRYLYILATSLLGFGLTISSMILTELLAWKRGLFAMQDSLHWISNSGFSIKNIQSVALWYFNSMTSFLVPYFPLATAAILVLAASVIYRTRKNRRWLWLGLLLLPPIGGQLMSNSAASYVLTGYESIVYISVVLVFYQAFVLFGKNISVKIRILIATALCAAFFLSNIAMLLRDKNTNETLACVWDSGSLEELQAIDFTYDRANGQPFSIDVVAEPYGINLKYAYLYSWYGQKTYGYTPVFIGGTQTGHPTEGLLKEANSYFPIHFIVYEPGTYNYWFHRRTIGQPATLESQNLFYYRQPSIEKLRETQQFGKLIIVDYYMIDQ